MPTSSVLLLLLLLSVGHGDQQNYSPPSGIVTLEKAQNMNEAPIEVSCPEPDDIEPCKCSNQDGVLRMDCSQVEDEEQLQQVFSASFPSTDFYRIDIRSNTGLKVLEDGVFGNVSFQVFVISSSVLRTVSNDAFKSSFSTLTEIHITTCELDSFPFERLAEFTSLTYLSLHHNKIPSLPPLSSSSLGILKLDYNPISELTPDVFTELSGISQIHLTGNNLTEIPPGTFKGHEGLFLIILSENKIRHLESLTFDLSLLSVNAEIFLDSNNIESVDVDAFTGVPAFSYIVLSNNSLTTLEEEVWTAMLERGIHLILEGNSLLCGCDVAWLVRSPILLQWVQHGRCADGTRLEELDPADFDMCD